MIKKIVVMSAAAFSVGAAISLISYYEFYHPIRCRDRQVMESARNHLCVWVNDNKHDDQELVSDIKDGCKLIIGDLVYPQSKKSDANQLEQMSAMWTSFLKNMAINISNIVEQETNVQKECKALFSFNVAIPFRDSPNRWLTFTKGYSLRYDVKGGLIIDWR